MSGFPLPSLTFAGRNSPLWLSSLGVDAIYTNKESAPPPARLNQGIIYELNDGILYFNGAPVAAGGVMPGDRAVVNTGATMTTPAPGYAIKLWQQDNNTGAGDVLATSVGFHSNFATASTATTITLDAGASAVDNEYQNMWIKITSGAGDNNVRQIVSYVGATKVATVSSAWSVDIGTPAFSIFSENYHVMVYSVADSAWRWFGLTNLEDPITSDGASEDTLMSAEVITAGLIIESPIASGTELTFDISGQTVGKVLTFTSRLTDNLVLNIKPPGVTATDIVVTDGAQTVLGAKSFSAAPKLTAASNQLVIQPSGAGNTMTLTAANPAAARIYTVPDVAVDTSFVMAAGNQTIANQKTFSGQIKLTAASNQLEIQANGAGNAYFITASNPGGTRTLTIPDPGTLSSLFLLADSGSVQTINSGLLECAAGLQVDTVLTLIGASNQLVISPGGSVNNYTITAAAAASARTYKIPDSGANSNFIMSSVVGATPNPTQGTSNTTAVTATAGMGAITMFGTIAANSSAAFTFNNTQIISGSNVIAWSNMNSVVLFKPVNVAVSAIAAGSCTITVTNTDAANATQAAAVVYYSIR